MTKRNLLHLVFTVLLLILAVAFRWWNKDTNLLTKYAGEISTYLQNQESDANGWIAKYQVKDNLRPDTYFSNSGSKEFSAQIAEDEKKDYTILAHQKDSVYYWSNNKSIPTREELAAILKMPAKTFFTMALGDYYVVRQSSGDVHYTTLIPIKYHLNIERIRNQHLFPANSAIPYLLKVGKTESPYPITVGGQTLCWMSSSENVRFARVQWYAFGISILFLFSLFTLINKLSIWAAEKYRTAAGSAVLIGSVALILLFNLQFDLTGQFDALPIFAQKFKSPSLGNSLGEWLFHICVLLWLMVFFHREFKVNDLSRFPLNYRLFLCTLNDLAMMMSILIGVYLFQKLIFESGVGFDFDNILNLDRYALLAIFGVILMLAGLFLFSHRIMQFIFRLELSVLHRVICLGLAALILYPFCANYQNVLSVVPRNIVAFGLIYVVAFDYYIDGKQPGFGWIVTWLFIFSFFSALLLYTYNDVNDFNTRLRYAREMAKESDELEAEPRLEKILSELKSDRNIDKMLPPREFDGSRSGLQNYLSKIVFEDNYLFQNYKISVYCFDSYQKPVFYNQEYTYDYIVKQNWESAKNINNNAEIRLKTDSVGSFKYILHRKSLRQESELFPADLYIFFEHEFPKPTKVYAKIFNNEPFKRLDYINQYDFAIFKGQSVLTEHGRVSAYLYDPANFPNPKDYFTYDAPDGSRTDVVYKNAEGTTTVAVGKPQGGLLKRLYLFTSLFTLLSIFMIALASVNSKLRFLPDYYQFVISTKGSLAKRIQYWTVGLIVVSFFVIGAVTYYHFSITSKENEVTKVDYRTSSLLAHIASATREMQPNRDSSLQRELPKMLGQIANSFSTDVNLYSRQGEMYFTTQENLRNVEILSRKMNTKAFATLSSQVSTSIREVEQIGSFEFFSNYAAIRNKNNELLGFIGVPYYVSGQSVSTDASDFLGKIATLYVFLLFVAGPMAFMVSNSIIKPIQLIANKITLLRLEDKNQPLEYEGDGQDELSALIEEYNRMVAKLEDSKAKLITLEREGAWREMARQVAHDIKNPLTGMKLSMQQLQRLSTGDAEEAREYLKKVISRMIVQIDSLAHIASEFSMFAKLDIAQKFDMVLNDVVENVYDLFSEMEEHDFQMNMSPDRYHILGDRNHLIRVFNNLIINATQAIPSDRRGIIRVAVYREGDNVVVRMSDNGGGIPPEVAERIFEPNFTTKLKGSGLGLAICKKIVDIHDGQIYFETRENDGTDFFVELPITYIESAENENLLN